MLACVSCRAKTGDGDFRNESESEPGYTELNMGLDDFDLVYSYPWPDEQGLCQHIVSRCGNPNARCSAALHRSLPDMSCSE